MKNRIAITGIGVVAPNGNNIATFSAALKAGNSGIKHLQELEKLKFACQVAGVPEICEQQLLDVFDSLSLRFINNSGLIYGVIAAMEAWQMAGLKIQNKEGAALDYAGCIMGTGLGGVEPLRDSIYKVDAGEVRRLGSRVVEQTMASGVSAWIGGKIGLGNKVSTNSSACSTGTEAIIDAAEHIRNGHAKVMIAGACDSQGPYIWGGFDSLRVLARHSNNEPEKASAPLSANAAGFVPGAGAGALILEDWNHAVQRKATILAEYLGGYVNSGGQRQGGSMTAPNPEAMFTCMNKALINAEISAKDISLISGHLTSTMGDVNEVKQWKRLMDAHSCNFPKIQALKSQFGHCLAAAGAIETVACVLQLNEHFIAPTLNALPLHKDIAELISEDTLVLKTNNIKPHIIAKSSFGFGDVNAILFLRAVL
jgi:3-oxoacyl-[acyl-carrier-protein] synthase I